MSPGVFALSLAAAIASAAVGGVFYAFSSFVMPGLARLPREQGIAAMQSINVTAVRPPFMLLFVGTAAVCVALIVWAILPVGDRPTVLLIVGSALYFVGAFALTMAKNVPLNDALDATDPAGRDAATVWAGYLKRWLAWNHVRGAASLAAAAAFTVALTL
ncbi:MAG TPA: anthrone oxygenase family protein [Solirubrobacteraceae bacterium]|nr:anthrone oxygenase family protein [Solirubrobacteraceae bacterium]